MFSPNPDQCTVLQARIADLEQQLHQCRMELQQIQQNQDAAAPNLHEILEQVPSAIARVRIFHDHRIDYLYCSRGHEAVFGYTPEELMTEPTLWLSRVTPADRETTIFQTGFESIFAEQSFMVEYRFCCKDGSLRWISSTFSSQRDDAADCWIATGASTDITDRKRAEAALQQLNQELELRIHERTRELEQFQVTLWERKQSFKTLVENTPDIVARFDRGLRHLYINPIIEQITGISAAQWIGKTQQDLGLPESLTADWFKQLQSVFDSGLPCEFEFGFASPHGLRQYQSKLVPEFAPDGSIASVLAISRDITNFKQAQDALYQSEQLFRAVFENAGVGIAVVFPPDFKLVRTNLVLQQMLGYSAEELETLDYVEITHPDDRALGAAFERQAGEQQSYSLEKRLICKNGQPVWVIVSISLLWDVNDQIRLGIGIVQDITSRKQAEKSLRQSEQQYTALAETVPVGIFYTDPQANSLYNNSRWYEMTGLTEAETKGLGWLQAVHPGDREQLAASWRSAIESSSSFQTEHRLIHRNGHEIWVVVQATPERDASGTLIGYLGTITDISDRKRIEEALRQSEALFRKLFEEAPIGIVLGRVDDRRLYKANQMFCQMFGYNAAELAELSYTDLTYSGDLAAELPLAEQMLAGLIPSYQLEKRYIRKNGEIFWGHLTTTILRNSANQPIIAFGMVQDITERKQTEEQLQHREALLREAQQIARLGSWEFDLITQKTIWSEEKFHIFGLNPGQPEPTYEQLLQQYIHPDDRDSLRLAVSRAIEQAEPYTLDLRIVQPDQTLSYVLIKGQPILNDLGQVVKLLGIIMDISDRKQTEALLQQQAQREQLLRLIAHRVRQSLDLDEILAAAVTEVRQTFGADRALIFRLLPEGKGQVIKEAVLPAYPALGEGLWTDACLCPGSIQYYYLGQPRIVSDVALDEWGTCLGQLLRQFGVRSKISAPIIQSLDGSTQIWGLLIVHACDHYRQWLPEEARFLQQISNQLAIAIQQSNLYQRAQTDLLERQQAENRLRASLQEKEVLLKEVHHRVKNNMQMISSLLSLQADSIQDPEVLQPFIESQRRVKTMALIHEKLYQSNNLAQINFADYVQQLADELLQSFKAARSQIQMVVEVADVNLTVDMAIPCGLIMSELVTNALKYAFPQGRSGRIDIRFIPDPTHSSSDSHHYILSIKDNGVGIPDQIDYRDTESLGLQIVCILTQKLKGTISLDRTHGTEFNVVVPLAEKIYIS
ncbi:MAG TPA: PAS domain S-box protein [Trichocoleus sp.]|jgi:PAS domain S-box-containing protein